MYVAFCSKLYGYAVGNIITGIQTSEKVIIMSRIINNELQNYMCDTCEYSKIKYINNKQCTEYTSAVYVTMITTLLLF